MVDIRSTAAGTLEFGNNLEEAPLPIFPQKFPQEAQTDSLGSKFQTEPTQEDILPRKVIKTIPELLNDQIAIRKFSEMGGVGINLGERKRLQDMLLGTISTSYGTKKPKVQEMVRRKILAALVPEFREIPARTALSFTPDMFGVAKDLIEAFKHPVQTFEGLKSLAMGAIALLIPGDQTGMVLPGSQTPVNEQGIRQLAGVFIENYGPVGDDIFGGAKRMLANHPVQFANDLSAILLGGGAILTKTGLVVKAERARSILNKAGDITSRVGKGIDPIQQAGRVVSKVGKTLGKAGTSLVASALKPVPPSRLTEAQKLNFSVEMSNKLLQSGLPIKQSTIELINNHYIKPLKNEMKKMIDDIDTAGKTDVTKLITREELVQQLDIQIDFLSKIEGNPFESQVKKLSAFRERFFKQSSEIVPAKKVQELKKELNKIFDENINAASEETLKVAAGRIRNSVQEILESVADDIGLDVRGVNRNMKEWIDLREAVARASREVLQSRTFKFGGVELGFFGGGIAGGVLGGGVGVVVGGVGTAAFIFVLEKVMTNPNVQLRIARLAEAANRAGQFTKTVTKASVPAFQTGRAVREGQESLSDKDNAIANELGGL